MRTRTNTSQLAEASLRVSVRGLLNGEEQEVLQFLQPRLPQTVHMIGLIRDNGLQSPLNRGRFYVSRTMNGTIDGVALIGHATLIGASSDDSIAAFAQLAQQTPHMNLIIGERTLIERFWNHYSISGQPARQFCEECFFEKRWPVEVLEHVPGLRKATLEDLNTIIPAHALITFEATGVNPLLIDPLGFRLRCGRRIEQGRVWVWIEDGRLIFKADVMSETPDVVYLEGVFVDPDERGRGYGLRCVSQLTRTLLSRHETVCLLVKDDNRRAKEFYKRLGFKLTGTYSTIFFDKSL